jgi:hypothetical protein
MQESVLLRTSKMAQIGGTLTAQGGLPLLKFFNAPAPPSCTSPDPANLLVSIQLPANPLAAAQGIASMLGVWQGNAIASGLAQCFRLYDAVPVCHVQGYVSEVWLPAQPYLFGQQINNINGVYSCALAGLSASTGTGPAGIGAAIQDGSCQWKFISFTPDFVLQTTLVQASALVTINSFSITAGNA